MTALTYCYNFVGVRHFYTRAETPLPAGAHQVRMEFAYDDDGIVKGGDVTHYVDGDEVAEGRVERTHLFTFSMDETTEVGSDAGAPVSEDYGPRDNAFNAPWPGSSSTSTKPPPTRTTSSPPSNDSGSPWRASDGVVARVARNEHRERAENTL